MGEFTYGGNGAGPNQLTEAGGELFSYDAVGQMRSYNGYDLNFDAAGKLVEARKYDNSVTLRFHYDFMGERLFKIVSVPGEADKIYRYVFDGYQERDGKPAWIITANGQKVAEVVDTPGLVPDLFVLDELAAYLQDPVNYARPAPIELMDFDGDLDDNFDADDMAVATARYWGEELTGPPVRVWRYYHPDHLGGPTHVTDSLGALVSHTRFHPYGETASRRGDQPIYGFTGAEIDRESDLGLIRMGARWYAPKVGRWVSADPLFLQSPEAVLPSEDDPTMRVRELNLFSYAANNSVSYTDPTGLAIWLEGQNQNESGGGFHQSIAVGDPNGVYASFSYGVTPDAPLGAVYRDDEHGGEIVKYIQTTPAQDSAFVGLLMHALESNDDDEQWFYPFDNCRTFSQKWFDIAARAFPDGVVDDPADFPERPPEDLDLSDEAARGAVGASLWSSSATTSRGAKIIATRNYISSTTTTTTYTSQTSRDSSSDE